MEKQSIHIKKLIFKIVFFGISTVVFVLLWNFLFINDNSNNDQNNETKVKSTTTDKKIIVYTLNKSPFSNDGKITYKLTTLDQLEKSKKEDIILIPSDYLKAIYKEKINNLADSGDSIIFYGDDISAEKVVLFFDGEIPVVPIESSIPLKFQAYGITTLNKELTPVFVSATSDQNVLNNDSFRELFIQIAKK